MTRRQRIVILVGTLVILASGLYPPWRMVRAGYPNHPLVTIKYGWVLVPPHLRRHEVMTESAVLTPRQMGIGPRPEPQSLEEMGSEVWAAVDEQRWLSKRGQDIVPWSEVEPRLDLYRLGAEWVLVALVVSGLCLAMRPLKRG